MSFFKKSKRVKINGGNFVSIRGKKGIDTLRKHIAPGAFHNSAERYDPPKCHPETRVAVIQEIIDWIEDGQKTSFIKWLNGSAGVGKSAIAQEIAEWCHESGCLAASFFWSRTAAGRNDETHLIASLAYQLLIAFPELRSHVEEAVETDPSIFDRSLEAQMVSLIVEPLQKTFGDHEQENLSTKVIVLDGLDECGTPEAQMYILKVIPQFIRKSPIPLVFLISSRPELVIRNSFNDHPLLPITVRLTLDQKYVPDADIRLFLVESFASVKRTHTLRSCLPRIWPIDRDIDQVVRKSSGQFIYAATVIKFVRAARRKPDEQLDIILQLTTSGNDNPFAELDALYYRIFSAVEDIPKVLDILSCLFLIKDLGYRSSSIASEIKKILFYASGHLQVVLIDLHSILHVPDTLDDDDDGRDPNNLRVLHASLYDFLMDPARSGNFHIDEGKAHASIAHHFLQYIRNYSPNRPGYESCDEVVFRELAYHCLHSRPTKELLISISGFDFRNWLSVRAPYTSFSDHKRDFIIWRYEEVVFLYNWVQSQISHMEENLDCQTTQYDNYLKLTPAALDSICEQVCASTLEEFGNVGKDALTALTCPQFSHSCGPRSWAFENLTGVSFAFGTVAFADNRDENFVELKNYLSDPKRAGKYFVDGGMYGALSLRILKFILSLGTPLVQIPVFQYAGLYWQYRDDRSETEEHQSKTREQMPLELAIRLLSFSLSKADYVPDLAELAVSVRTHKLTVEDGTLKSEIEFLHETIDRYLTEALSPPNGSQELFVMSAPESGQVNSVSESMNDRYKAFSEQQPRVEKRRRKSESLVMNNLITTQAPLPPLFKRSRIADMLTPAVLSVNMEVVENELYNAPGENWGLFTPKSDVAMRHAHVSLDSDEHRSNMQGTIPIPLADLKVTKEWKSEHGDGFAGTISKLRASTGVKCVEKDVVSR